MLCILASVVLSHIMNSGVSTALTHIVYTGVNTTLSPVVPTRIIASHAQSVAITSEVSSETS
jgi:hypothetical protein